MASRQPDWQWKLDIVVSALITIDKRLQKKGHVAQLQIATLTQFLSNIGRDVPRPSFGGMKTDDADRIVVLPSQHVLDHGFEIAGGVGFGPDQAAFAAIVHYQIDGLIVLAGHDRWCPTGPVHHQLQRYITWIQIDPRRIVPVAVLEPPTLTGFSGRELALLQPVQKPDPREPKAWRCPKCDAQPAPRTMLDPQTGRIFHMFECACGRRTWTSEPA